jgi:hypothetical protein
VAASDSARAVRAGAPSFLVQFRIRFYLLQGIVIALFAIRTLGTVLGCATGDAWSGGPRKFMMTSWMAHTVQVPLRRRSGPAPALCDRRGHHVCGGIAFSQSSAAALPAECPGICAAGADGRPVQVLVVGVAIGERVSGSYR